MTKKHSTDIPHISSVYIHSSQRREGYSSFTLDTTKFYTKFAKIEKTIFDNIIATVVGAYTIYNTSQSSSRFFRSV